MQADHSIPTAAPELWSHQSAYASLKASAMHFAGLENARALIRQSRQIRYLRYVQLEHLQTQRKQEESERSDAPTETAELKKAA